MVYRPRIVDDELRQLLGGSGAVVIEGPKASGKTATATRAAADIVRFDTDGYAIRREDGVLVVPIGLLGP